jgi:alanine racemase
LPRKTTCLTGLVEDSSLPNEQGDAAGLRLTIDLGALAANWRRLAAECDPAECAAVVKADAYGIGIEEAVPALWSEGCRTFFVALPKEGRRVREVANAADIYVLNGFAADASELYREHELRPVLNSLEEIEAWARLLPGRPSALHIDTGMNRLGLSGRDALELARHPNVIERVAPRMLMSHLACSEAKQHPLNRAQLALFEELRAHFPTLPCSFANSAGIFLGSEYHFDMVRPGIALYGASFAEKRPPLNTVITLEARILQVRKAFAGETVGYGAMQMLRRDSRIAVLSAGYADGYPRAASSRDDRPGAKVSIRGRAVPIVGRVSMDLIAADVTDIDNVVPGDWAELFGPNMPIDDVAAAAGTIGYELLTSLSRRAKRVYINGRVPP